MRVLFFIIIRVLSSWTDISKVHAVGHLLNLLLPQRCAVECEPR